MNKTMKCILSTACVAATIGSLALLSGCGREPAVVTPIDTEPTKETVAVPKTQLTLSDVMAINSSSLKWSRLSLYEHTVGDDGTATFKVADTYGKEATLVAVFDEEADTISKADLTYEDETVSILTDNNFDLLPVMQAMYEEAE